MKEYSFEKLEVWQDSRVFAVKIYRLTSQFPAEEKFGLTNQVRRAAVSVCSNIAEGNSKRTSKDKANYMQIAYASMMEVLNHIIIAKDLQMISEEDYTSLRLDIEKITNKLNSLRNYYLKTT